MLLHAWELRLLFILYISWTELAPLNKNIHLTQFSVLLFIEDRLSALFFSENTYLQGHHQRVHGTAFYFPKFTLKQCHKYINTQDNFLGINSLYLMIKKTHYKLTQSRTLINFLKATSGLKSMTWCPPFVMTLGLCWRYYVSPLVAVMTGCTLLILLLSVVSAWVDYLTLLCNARLYGTVVPALPPLFLPQKLCLVVLLYNGKYWTVALKSAINYI